jgi:hypothetical protein
MCSNRLTLVTRSNVPDRNGRRPALARAKGIAAAIPGFRSGTRSVATNGFPSRRARSSET